MNTKIQFNCQLTGSVFSESSITNPTQGALAKSSGFIPCTGSSSTETLSEEECSLPALILGGGEAAALILGGGEAATIILGDGEAASLVLGDGADSFLR